MQLRCCLEEQLRDRLVAGVEHAEVKQKLLKEDSLTYKKAKQILESWNDISNATVNHSDIQPSEVLFNKRVSSKPQRKNFQLQHESIRKGQNQFSSSHSSSKPTGRCQSCGGQHLRSSCKFRQAECHACHKIGHIAKVCRSSSKLYKTYKVETDLDVNVFTVNKSEHIYRAVTFNNGETKQFVVDTGSPISFLPLKDFYNLGFSKEVLQPSTAVIKGVSGHELRVIDN